MFKLKTLPRSLIKGKMEGVLRYIFPFLIFYIVAKFNLLYYLSCCSEGFNTKTRIWSIHFRNIRLLRQDLIFIYSIYNVMKYVFKKVFDYLNELNRKIL